VFQNESNKIAAVFAAREDLAKHTGYVVLIRVIGVVQNAVDTRAFTFVSCSEYVTGDGVRHAVTSLLAEVF